MKPSAALLIDLENFYHSRRAYFAKLNLPVGQQPEFVHDLALLIRCAEEMAERPLAVRRAYANFNTLPAEAGPRELMHQGVEPVQVFCLSDSSNKNAADMKLAMDAVALATGGPFEHFVLVTGDADFVPVILELKRRGLGVSAVAVTGSTSPLIKQFVDHFKRFEDLSTRSTRAFKSGGAGVPIAAPQAPAAVRGIATGAATNGDEFDQVAAALRRVLARTQPVRLDRLHRELSRELGAKFEPAAFGCTTTSLFVRRNAASLGVVVARGVRNELFVERARELAAPANDTHHLPSAPEPHTAAHYKALLASGAPGSNEDVITVVPWASLARACDDTFTVLTPSNGTQKLTRSEYIERLYATENETGLPNYRSHARHAVRVLKLSNAVLETNGGVALHPEVTSPDDIRWAVLGIMLSLLDQRLRENEIPGRIRAEVFCAAIAAGRQTDELVPQIAQAIESMEQAGPAAPEAPAQESATVGNAAEPFADPATGARATTELAPEFTTERPHTPEVALEPFATSAESEFDPGTANATIPEFAAGQPGSPTDASLDGMSMETPSSGVIDVAALTRAAVAAVRPGSGKVDGENAAQSESEFTLEPVPAAEVFTDNEVTANTVNGHMPSEAVNTAEELARLSAAPASELPAELARTAVTPESPSVDDDYPLAIPVGDWLPEGETHRTAPATRTPNTPLALSSRDTPGAAAGAVAKIEPHPPETAPAPLPPLPPPTPGSA